MKAISLIDFCTLNSKRKYLLLEWNVHKNGDMESDLTIGSNKKVWWKCEKGHEWEASVVKRVNGTNCPFCSNKKVLRGYNDLVTTMPAIAQEWNYNRNTDLFPYDVVSGSNKRVWWKCKKGHEWEATINDRVSKGQVCPYCSGNIVIKGENDLATINPELAKEWNYNRNDDLPCDYFPVSGKKVWWKCKRGHEWEAKISNRSNGKKCPYCANKKVLYGYNDLKTIKPELVKEWDYEKNNKLLPEEFVACSNKKVWWKCYKGHEWKTAISNRFYGSGCPLCNIEYGTSFAEQTIFYYVKKIFKDTISRYNDLGFELDIYIPSKLIAIEYDGDYYHSSDRVNKDIKKNIKCKTNNIKLIRIQEKANDAGLDSDYYYERKKPFDDCSTLDECVKFIFDILNIKDEQYLIDSQRDKVSIMELYKSELFMNSLENNNPLLVKEWNYCKNGSLTPAMFSRNSREKVWWKCERGHEWKASIDNRSKGNKCPFCSGKRVLVGNNDLASISPDLAKEWNCEKNGTITAKEVLPNSNKKVWWKCKKGHEWEAVVSSRYKGSGCPYCAGQMTILGLNDLMTKNPSLAKEWHSTKNGQLTPSEVMPNSNRKVWWKCKKGHEWEAVISRRNKGAGCPYCKNKKVLRGYNDLNTTHPEIAKEWNYDKNEDLTPNDVVSGSHKKMWWKCSCGHEWQASIANRTTRGCGCPICKKK